MSWLNKEASESISAGPELEAPLPTMGRPRPPGGLEGDLPGLGGTGGPGKLGPGGPDRPLPGLKGPGGAGPGLGGPGLGGPKPPLGGPGLAPKGPPAGLGGPAGPGAGGAEGVKSLLDKGDLEGALKQLQQLLGKDSASCPPKAPNLGKPPAPKPESKDKAPDKADKSGPDEGKESKPEGKEKPESKKAASYMPSFDLVCGSCNSDLKCANCGV